MSAMYKKSDKEEVLHEILRYTGKTQVAKVNTDLRQQVRN